ncbi:hypothetical protein [Streptomyces sp. NPDC001889]
MHQRTTLLALTLSALLGLTGCVSVPAEPLRGPRVPSGLPDHDRTALPAGPAGRQEPALASRGPGRGAEGSGRQTPRGTARPGPGGAPAARATIAVPLPRPPRTPAPDPRDLPPRAPVPVPPVPGPPEPRETYDMKSLCDSSAGITDPSVTGMCRDSYR